MALDFLKTLFPEPKVVNTIKRGFEGQRKLYVETQLTNIRNRDPKFNAAGFLKYAGDVLLKIKSAFHSHNISTVSPLMTDGMRERLNVQIGFQRSGGYRDCMECIQVVDSRICQIDSGFHFDAIHVRLAGDGISKRTASSAAPAGNKRVLSGPESRVFKEVWSFLRRPGAKTKRHGSLREGLCPNCGASVRLTDRMKCRTCGSIINSGQHDWILFKLSDVSEWKARDSTRHVPGLGSIQRLDPGFCAEFLEDRSAVVFWRWRQALTAGKADPLVRFSLPSFLKKLLKGFQGEWIYCRDVTVHSVRLIDVEIGHARDRVYVQVRWSGTGYRSRLKSGRPAFLGPGMRTHVLVLERDHGVRTNTDTGLNSSHCAGCGAPEEKSTSGACLYCGTPFADGKHHWILADIILYYDWTSRRRKASRPLWLGMDFHSISGIEPSVVMAWLVKIMFADKRAGAREMALVEAFGRSRNFLHEKIVKLIQAERRGELDLPAPGNRKEALGCLRVLVWMALSDGRVAKEEADLLLAFASRFRISPAKVSELVKSETSHLQKRLQLK